MNPNIMKHLAERKTIGKGKSAKAVTVITRPLTIEERVKQLEQRVEQLERMLK